jgi:hypothetical protein
MKVSVQFFTFNLLVSTIVVASLCGSLAAAAPLSCSYFNTPVRVYKLSVDYLYSYVSCPTNWIAVSASSTAMSSGYVNINPVPGFWVSFNTTATSSTCAYLVPGVSSARVQIAVNVYCCDPASFNFVGGNTCGTIYPLS